VTAGPNNAEAHNNLGAVMLASGDASGAIPHLRQAVELRPFYPEAHFNLARAYGSTGQFDPAIHEATVARDQAEEAGKADLLARIREQLQVYRAGIKP
jgi:Flp pilus assembly protein TadD